MHIELRDTMMKINLLFTFLTLSAISHGAVFATNIIENDAVLDSELTNEAKLIAKRFGSTLKPKLKQALQSGGFEHAVNVCSIEAPKIAQQLSIATGWQVKRVSIKPRNYQTAKPDGWEAEVLQRFEEKQKQGIPVTQLSFSETVADQFRFIKAQGVEPLCLNCHGTNIQPTIKKVLSQYYPEDRAIGYQQGQIRGAISLTKKL